MNKKKLLNIFVLLFIMGFVLPLNTKALTFNDCKGVEHSVDSTETLVDYAYFTKDSSVTDFVVYGSYGTYYIYSAICSSPNLVKYSSRALMFYSDPNFCNDSYTLQVSCPTMSSCGSFSTVNTSTIYFSDRDFYYNPVVYTDITLSNVFMNASSYNEQSILTKYNCNGGSEPEPEPSEEVNMFDVVSTFLVQFINILPFMIPFILIMNLICRMLFNERS